MNIPESTLSLQETLSRGANASAAKNLAEAQASPPNTPIALQPGQSFLDRLNSLKAIKPLTEQDEKVRAQKVAGDLVANALILPVMKQIRRSVWAKDGLFTGGTGEKTFGPEFDMQIADRIAHSPRMTVTASLAQRLMARANDSKPATEPAGGATRKTGVDLHG